MDISAPVGQPIYAMFDGQVSYVTPKQSSTAGWWIEVVFEIEGTMYLNRYMHLDKIYVKNFEYIRENLSFVGFQLIYIISNGI